MAHIMTKRGNLDNIVTYQHICDTTADLSNISQEYRTLGSIAIVIEGEGGGLEIYITNSNKQWIPLTVSSTSSGEGVTLAEVNELIADALEDITGFNTQIVNELPESDINTGTIYLVANNNGNDNGYDEYIYVNNNWQKIGSTTNIQQLHNIRDGHGQSSIEEGNLSSSGGVSATGQYSHAEGLATIASAQSSHAEGTGTTASGNYSHAEGGGTIASGGQSHAEGGGTTASKICSHAEGGGTTASGNYSHAEGSLTTASGTCSHTEGGQTVASGDYSHTEGGGTTASGMCSHAEGSQATASGKYSHVEGNDTIANHRSQHVFGEYNIADDNISASDVHGTYVEIVGNGTSKVLRSNARTLDWDGNEQLAGSITLAGNISRGRKADTVVGGGSFAFGAEITASGQYSHAEGNLTTASGAGSHAEGGGTTASGNYSHAECAGTIASGIQSHAEGGGTTASGSQSHAEGNGTTASNYNSHAEGAGTAASGNSSHAEGAFTIANHKAQHVFGEYNIADDNISASNARGTYVEIVGNGTFTGTSITRSNARTLDWNGNQTLAGTLTTSSNGITIGNTTLTEAQLQSIFTRLAALEQAAPASGNNANYIERDDGYIGG